MFRVGEWRVDAARDVIADGTTEIKLEPRTTRLLCVLAERAGAVVSAEELLQRVWPGLVVSQHSVYQGIASLRRALRDDGEAPRYIETVPRKGYRLIAAVQFDTLAVPPSAPLPQSTVAAIANAQQVGPKRRLAWWWRAAAGLLVFALGAWVILGIWPPAAGRETPSIAVLPFKDLGSAAQEDPAFVAGLTEELTHTLARVPSLRVAGLSSAAAAGAGAPDPRRIGALLGVTHVLQGSVRPHGGRVRVSAQLIATADGFPIWSNSYDRARTDAILVQTDIAREVVESLRIKLSDAEREQATAAPTALVSAYDFYLLGRHQQLQRTPESLARAVEYHRKAISIDPRFALAYAGLADAQMAGFYYSNRSLDETAGLVEPAVAAALAIDPELAEALAARAVLRIEQWRMDEAIADLQRAIAINPNSGEFHVRLGGAYEYAGRPRDALRSYEQALTLDPLHAQLHVRRCLVLQNLGRYAEADAACDRSFELQPENPSHFWARGLNRYAQGQIAAAVEVYREALERAPHRTDIRSELGLLLLDLGDVAAAQDEIARAREAGGGRQVDVELAALR
ncbi:MAG: tetratricopeptide repeat protein, partial [Steroidobacteraceae bacterium]|nr:tetratricopeptide repeat protein [Steroidobacteraceae bacterium]